MKTEQLWRGDFGDTYTKRNIGLVERNVAFLARALSHVRHPIASALEFGCGTGQNIEALRRLMRLETADGIEINSEAASAAAAWCDCVYQTPVREWRRPETVGHWDLVLSKGFLIHVPPDQLPNVYAQMFDASGRYILLAEYYNPVPVEVEYRGALGRMWKRDFATEFLGRFPSLRVVDYGFCWRYDPWPQDDLTYFLLEKR